MDNTVYQTMYTESAVSMPLVNATNPVTATSFTTSHLPYYVHDLSDHGFSPAISRENFGQDILQGIAENLSLLGSPAHAQWFDSFIAAPNVQQQQSQPQQPKFIQHGQQMQPHHHNQQPQHQSPQSDSMHCSFPPHDQTMQQQSQKQQNNEMNRNIGSLNMCSSQALVIPNVTPSNLVSLMDRTIMEATSPSLDPYGYQPVSTGHFSSPEIPSPCSDQGFFDMTTDDETASCCSSYKSEIISREFNISQAYISPSSRKRRTSPSSSANKAGPAIEQIMLLSPNATMSLTTGPSFIPASLQSLSPSLSTIPALPSPLKQNFICSNSSDSDSHEDDDDMGKAGSTWPSSATRKKKRERRSTRTGQNKPKSPSVKLPCSFAGCTTTCSSLPSLQRHEEAHKWRGLYAPVRCEACHSALSNEFSVQRHIVRSPPNSRCRRLRVYSIMMSETEIETSVRFYPKRAHGKKTVVTNLEYARAKYLGDFP
ncbi:hypothetical protein FBU30_006210 [Linnemannia zychae]|nr:hypothetical protein FBU30_006210 [Linnemannia zychae]